MGEYRGSGIGVSKGHGRIGPAPSPSQPRSNAIDDRRKDGIAGGRLGSYPTQGATPAVGTQTPPMGPEFDRRR
jgi:hypothetical protein